MGYALVNHTGSMNLASGSANKYISIGGSVSGSGSRLYVKGSTSDDTAKAFNVFDSSSSELFVVRNDGNVGIGTATPSQPLHVVGDMKVDGGYIDFREAGGGLVHIQTSAGNSALSIGSLTNPSVRQVAIGHILTSKASSVQIGGRDVGGGTSSVAIGDSAMENNTNSSNNIAIGQSTHRFKNGSNTVAIGNGAMYGQGASGTGDQSVAIGSSANSHSGDNVVAVGYTAGRNSTGNNNVSVGHSAGLGVDGTSTFSNTVAVGYQALTALTTGASNTAVGYQALTALTTGIGNTALGYQAGSSLLTGNNNFIVGVGAGAALTTGGANILLGQNAGNKVWNQGNNIAIGNNALFNGTAGENIAIGNEAIGNGGTGVAVGGSAGRFGMTHGTFVGIAAGYLGGDSSVGLGKWGGAYLRGERNVSVGFKAGQGVAYTSNTSNNVFIGYEAGAAITSGGSNVLIGYQAGSALTTEANKLYIENSNSTTPLIYGEFDNDILRVNGTLQVNDPASTGYALPAATGTTGQALVVNASGDVEFGDVGIDGLVTTLDSDDIRSWRPGYREFGVDTSVADDSSLNLSLGEGHPRDLYFKPDGTKCYVVGNGLDDIHEIPLTTAWDLQSATVANIIDVNLAGSSSIGGGGFEGNLYGIHIADDANDSSTYGKKFFIVGSQKDEIQEYTATTAWDASTISTAATDRLYVGAQDANPSALRFTPDGQTLYVLDGDNDASPRCRVWDLTTAWDLSTATYNSSKDITFSTVDRNARGLDFNSNGSKVYITTPQNYIHEYDLSTAYDITTLSYVRSLNTAHFRSFIHGKTNNSLNETYGSLEGIYFVKSASDQYAFLLYNNGDEIIRLKRTGLIQSNDTIFEGVVDAKALNVSGTTLLGETRFLGGVVISGAPYIQGAMNWAGFNSGPIKGATSSHDALTFGSNVKSIGFADNINQNPDSHDLNNTVNGTWLHRSESPQDGAYNIIVPKSSGTIKLDTDKSYLNAFNTEATAKVTGATEDIEYYYTARADGQGEFQRQLGALPASGQTLTRTSYYSDKAFADPDTAADWTSGTAYTSTSLASSISQSADTLLNAQATGTPPLSTKIVISNFLGSSGLISGDSNGFGGTSVVYSLRLLNHIYDGAAIRVVNDSAVEADIGFNSSLELDTTALLTHCGSGDGYLVKWYDQAQGGPTGDGNDASWDSSTTYSSRKPQIVSAGSVILDNGKPCVETIDAGMLMESEFSASGEYDVFIVCQKTINNGNHGMLFGTRTGNDNRIWMRDNTLNLQVNNEATDISGLNDDGSSTLRFYQLGQMVLNVRRDASGINSVQRNAVVGSSTYTNGGAFRGDRIINSWNNKQYSFGGNVQEIIILDGDKSSERAAIQSNINTYYSIY